MAAESKAKKDAAAAAEKEATFNAQVDDARMKADEAWVAIDTITSKLADLEA